MNLPLLKLRLFTVRAVWFETVALTALMPLIGYAVNADDPFFLNNQFPWLILAPLLISLRYGFLFGMSSTLVLIALFILGRNFNWNFIPVFPLEQVVGMIAITVVTSEFNERWQQKIVPLQRKYEQLTLRMKEFSRAYQLLKGSHSLLEQQTASHKTSLRDSLLNLHKHTLEIAKNDGEPLVGIGDRILELFSHFGSVQTASIHAVSDAQKISMRSIACLGNPPSFWPTNPLIREAFKTGYVTSIQSYNEDMSQEIIVVVPLVDVFQKIWGMVIINEMSMFALQENTLNLLSLLGGYMGDLVRCRADSSQLSQDVWKVFEHEVRCVMKDVSFYKVEAAVVVVINSSLEKHNRRMARFNAELRGQDKVMSFSDLFDRHVIISLLPLTDEQGLKDFLLRFDLMCPTEDLMLVGTDEARLNHASNRDECIYSGLLNKTYSPEAVLLKIAQVCQGEKTIKQGDLSCADISA